jgi:hypothetical protein
VIMSSASSGMHDLSSRNARAMGAIRHGHWLALSKSRGWSKERWSWHALITLNMFSPGDWRKAERLARGAPVCPNSCGKPFQLAESNVLDLRTGLSFETDKVHSIIRLFQELCKLSDENCTNWHEQEINVLMMNRIAKENDFAVNEHLFESCQLIAQTILSVSTIYAWVSLFCPLDNGFLPHFPDWHWRRCWNCCSLDKKERKLQCCLIWGVEIQ